MSISFFFTFCFENLQETFQVKKGKLLPTGRSGGGKKRGANNLIHSSRKVAASYSPALAVPSALQGLTSLFGMVRGGALAL